MHRHLSYIISICAVFLFSTNVLADGVCGSLSQYSASDCYDWLKQSCNSPYRVDQGKKGNYLSYSYEAYQRYSDQLQSPFAKSVLCRAPPVMGLEDIRADFETLQNLIRAGALREMTKEKAVQDTRVGLALVMLDLFSNVQKMQIQDVDSIDTEFTKLSKKTKTDQKTVSMDDLKTLFEGHFISKSMDKVSKRGSIQHMNFNEYVRDQFLGAYNDVESNESNKNQEAYMKQLKTSGPDSLMDGMKSFLNRFPSDEARYEFLVKQAKSPMAGGDVEGNLTPYHAKMILYYLYGFRANGDKKLLDNIANKMNLKMLNGQKSKGWNSTVPHNGYVLGASGSMISSLAHDEKDSSYGNGIDCTTAVQETLSVTLGKKFKGRMTSAGLSGNQYSETFEKISIDKASDAIPEIGDVITKRTKGQAVGHGEVMVGFRGDPPKALVVSAQGGFDRGVVLKEVDVFPGAPDSCSQSHYTEDPSHHYSLLRLKTHASIFKF